MSAARPQCRRRKDEADRRQTAGVLHHASAAGGRPGGRALCRDQAGEGMAGRFPKSRCSTKSRASPNWRGCSAARATPRANTPRRCCVSRLLLRQLNHRRRTRAAHVVSRRLRPRRQNRSVQRNGSISGLEDFGRPLVAGFRLQNPLPNVPLPPASQLTFTVLPRFFAHRRGIWGGGLVVVYHGEAGMSAGWT